MSDAGKNTVAVNFTKNELDLISQLCDIAWQTGNVRDRRGSALVADIQDRARKAAETLSN